MERRGSRKTAFWINIYIFREKNSKKYKIRGFLREIKAKMCFPDFIAKPRLAIDRLTLVSAFNVGSSEYEIKISGGFQENKILLIHRTGHKFRYKVGKEWFNCKKDKILHRVLYETNYHIPFFERNEAECNFKFYILHSNTSEYASHFLIKVVVKARTYFYAIELDPVS